MPEENHREISSEELLQWERLADEAGFLKLDDETSAHGSDFANTQEPVNFPAREVEKNARRSEVSEQPELNGQFIGAFELVRQIGQGGSGIVYEAWQMAPLRRKVAIKLLNTDIRYGEIRWQAEVQALAALKHPAIVQVYEAGMTDSGARYLVMPLIEGTRIDSWSGIAAIEAKPTQADLADQDLIATPTASKALKPKSIPSRVETRRTILAAGFPNGRHPRPVKTDLPAGQTITSGHSASEVRSSNATTARAAMKSPLEIASVMLEVAKAVAYAHGTGILHRDLKPSNILVSANGKPTITDFGLAKHLDSPAFDSVTTSGMLIGSIGFMAPEQLNWSNDYSGPAVDIYGFGATLYFLLTARMVIRTDSFSQAVNDLANRPPSPIREFNRSVPQDLDAICLKCLEKSPADRYQSMDALADDLQRFLHGLPVSVIPVRSFGRVKRWCRREPFLATIALVVPLLLAITAVSLAWLWQRSEFNRVRMQQNLDLAVDILRDELTAAEAYLPNVKGSLDYRIHRQKAAIGFLAKLLADNPENTSIKRRLAVAQYLLGMLPKTEGRHQERYQAFQAALVSFRELAEDYPEDRSLQFDIVHSLLGLSDRQSDLGLTEERQASLDEALRRMELIAEAEPDNPDYQDALAFVLTQVARRYSVEGTHETETDLGHVLCARAIEIASRLSADFPERPNYIRHIIGGNLVRNIIANYEQDYPAAIRFAAEALHFANLLFERMPEDPTNHQLCINANREFARTLVSAGQIPEAIRYQAKAIALAERLVETYPDHSPFREIRNQLQPYLEELLSIAKNANGN